MLPCERRLSLVLRFWRLPFVLGMLVLGVDQASKLLIVQEWPLGTQHELIPGFFRLVHFRNPGAAWGMFADHTGILAILSGLVLMGVVVWFDQLVDGFPERAVALGVVLGGVAGNLVDRVVYHEVIDFLLFYWRTFQWPAFNVADSAISCGVTAFVLSSFFRRKGCERVPPVAASAGPTIPPAPRA